MRGPQPRATIRVYHKSYGCETGCCGHSVEVDGVDIGFDFEHPHVLGEAERRAWAREFVEEMLRKHAPECLAEGIDWDSMVFEVSND